MPIIFIMQFNKIKASIYSLVVLLIFITSCERVYRLSDKDKRWLTYKKGQKLIFKSSMGDIDSVICTDVILVEGFDNMYNPMANKYEEITISVLDKKNNYPIKFIELTKSKDQRARLLLDFLPGNSTFYGLNGFSIDSLGRMQSKRLKISNKTFDDVFFLYPDDIFNRKQEKDYVTKVYFSKKYGVVRFERQDGVYWELKNI